MDRKGVLILVISFVALLMWPALMRQLYPPKPVPLAQRARTNDLAAATNVPAPAAHVPQPSPPSVPAAEAAPAASKAADVPAEQVLVLTNQETRYLFTTHGGGLKRIELMDYPAQVSKRSRRFPAAAAWASLNTSALAPVMGGGSAALQGDGVFALSRHGAGVRAEKTLTNGLAVIKDFELLSNRLFQVTLRLENRSSQPLALPVQEWIAGTATPAGAADDANMLGVFWYDGRGADHVQAGWFANRTLGCFPGTPREVFTGGENNVGWVAVHNQFFALAVIAPTQDPASQVIAREIPLPPLVEPADAAGPGGLEAQGQGWLFGPDDFRDLGGLALKLGSSADALSLHLSRQLSEPTRAQLPSAGQSRVVSEAFREVFIADLNRILQGPSLYEANRDHFSRTPLPEKVRRWVEQVRWPEEVVRGNRLALQHAYSRELVPHEVGFEASLVYPASQLAPGAASERTFMVYAGPKEYRTLSRLGGRWKNDLDAIMDFGVFGWFAQLLLLSMNGLNSLGFSYGWAIIVITIVIKILFWPLTNVSTRSMKRMAALQPQMKALQDKYKEDPQKLQHKMWEFYKEHKINPAAGCLPVLVQMPIFFGFFTMIRTAIELRGARFLWITDLSQPDTLFMVPGLNVPFNLLPLIMGATMLWQARLTPASPGMDPMQQKLMKYMPLIFLAMLYNFSAGLTLYWTVQNLLSIVQTKLTRTAEARPGPPPTPVSVPLQKRKRK
ncbi:MAG: membrane protein insertase YidC [Verrucomicrobia bacterium]|nr:membrane protein insertase YidC [Verrucomicrobiota bacterium]